MVTSENGAASFPLAYARRSSASFFLGNSEAAREDARRAIELGYDRIGEYVILSFAFEGDEKRSVLRQGMKLAKKDSFEFYHLWHDLARSYFYEGDFAREASELRALSAVLSTNQQEELRDTHAVVLMSLGTALSAAGSYAEAEAAYRDALHRMRELPQREMVASWMVLSRLRGGDAAGALALARQHASADDVGLHAILGFFAGSPPMEVGRLRSRIPQEAGMDYDQFAVGIGLFTRESARTAQGCCGNSSKIARRIRRSGA